MNYIVKFLTSKINNQSTLYSIVDFIETTPEQEAIKIMQEREKKNE